MNHPNGNANATNNANHNTNNTDDDDSSSTTTSSSGGGKRCRHCRHALMVTAEIAILLLCLPCLLASTMIDRRRRHCQEHPRRYRHTVLLAAPTRRTHVVINEFSASLPPAAEATEVAAARAAAARRTAAAGGDDPLSRRRRLLIPANRVFCVKRDAGVLLASGNVATSAPGFEIAGTPRLVATVPARRWRDMLCLFKAERDALAAPPSSRPSAAAAAAATAAAATVKMAHMMLRAGSLSRSASRQKAWVRRCCHVLRRDFDVSGLAAAAAHRDGGGSACSGQLPEEETFQIWEVHCWAHEKVAVEEIVFDTEVARVHLSNNRKCLWSTRLFIPPGASWVGGDEGYNSVGQRVDDLFEGDWTAGYLAADPGSAGRPLRVNYRGDWIESFGPRRSLDSVLEKVPSASNDDF